MGVWKDQCHQDCGLRCLVCVAAHHAIVCSARRGGRGEVVAVWGGISESTTVNKRGEGGGRERERLGEREGEERRTEVLFITAVGE